MSERYLEGKICITTLAGARRDDGRTQRRVQITPTCGFIQFDLEDLPIVLEALGRVAVEELDMPPPASAPARCLGCEAWCDRWADYCHGCDGIFCVVCCEGLPPKGHNRQAHLELAEKNQNPLEEPIAREVPRG